MQKESNPSETQPDWLKEERSTVLLVLLVSIFHFNELHPSSLGDTSEAATSALVYSKNSEAPSSLEFSLAACFCSI